MKNKVKTIFEQPPDVEVVFEFNGRRKTPATDGYRPSHLVVNDYLTTGIHHYYNVDTVAPNGSARGTITFLSPEAYPYSLWIGKKLNIQEGERIVGYATIIKIFNPLLDKDNQTIMANNQTNHKDQSKKTGDGSLIDG